MSDKDKKTAPTKSVSSKWYEYQTVLYRTPNSDRCAFNGKIFGTDLVGTLIQAKNGDSMPRSLEDWVWCSDKIPEFLNQKHKEGFTIAIFSNYQRVANNAGFKESLKARVEKMLESLSFDPFFFASLSTAKNDKFCKPNIGMFDLMKDTGIPIDLKQSSYTGDRFDVKVMKGADILFANNIKVPFYKPSEIYPQQPWYTPSGKQELLIMVGNQGSGKSTNAKRYEEKGYSIIARNGKKHTNEIVNLLKSGKSVIFDATNPSKENRAELITLATQNGAVPIILWCSRDGRYDNELRTGKDKVPKIVYSRYQSSFEEPSSTECEMHRLN
ncbi:MAG: PNK3P-domain-containing protein [Solumvirus sp.]|uniref:PNK3P-domain-containing protein n=1 Tax=Solumvirus sp. TaxID=2487773 RepID=A0A3G5AGG3_9VIRU|nr:MAG: PNK3P-domain-containing protein [Solumvirus sp.]